MKLLDKDKLLLPKPMPNIVMKPMDVDVRALLNDRIPKIWSEKSDAGRIGVSDLMRQADIARGATRDSFTFYAIAAVMYLVLTAVTTAVLARVEQRVNRGIRRA